MKKLCLLLIFFSSFGFSQYSIDSLKHVADNESADKFARATAYFEISNIEDENLIEEFCNKAFSMLALVDSTKVDSKEYYNLKGSIYGNLGYYYRTKGLITKAFDKYFTALKYSEKTDNKYLYADMKNNIGMLYYSQKQYRESIPYYYKAIEVYKLIGKDDYEARTYMNLAGAFQNTGNFPSAIFNFKKALNMFIQQKDSFYIGFAYNNIAVCFKDNNLADSAFNYLNKSLPYFQKLNSKDELAWTYDILAGIYVSNKEYTKAEPYCKMCVEIAQERNLPDQMSSCLKSLFVINRAKGDFKLALQYYMQSDSLKDSLVNNSNRLLLAKTQVEYDFSKKEELLNIESEKKALQFKEEDKRNKIIIFSVIAILGVSLFFGYMVFKSLRLEKLAKKTVLDQKEIIEEKQKEIIDSITYAKRIQDAILPPENYWKQNLPNSFVLYKPKDIVAGDFYWMEKRGDLLFFAAADCTGHGVPGAMVSVVCCNSLNRSLLEFKITEPGKLLDKTRELVLETFSKSGEEIKDGMDISLCCLNTSTNHLMWAGANNPLWLVEENGNANVSIKQIKPDKQPIGKYSDESPFTTHSFMLQKNDIFYIFTDGYPDQFGGPKGKKFKYKQLEDLLVSMAAKPMEQQKSELLAAFNLWKGSLEQIDDVCIIGIRI